MNIEKRLGIQPAVRGELSLRDKALSGDMVWSVSPLTVTPVPIAGAWTRTVVVELQTAAGETHTWFNDAIASGNSIANACGGTPTIASTTLTIVNGRAVVIVTGPSATYANSETDTYTVTAATIMGTVVASVDSLETFTTA
jgi:hypothetical protein